VLSEFREVETRYGVEIDKMESSSVDERCKGCQTLDICFILFEVVRFELFYTILY
jgi:hypothetical protein